MSIRQVTDLVANPVTNHAIYINPSIVPQDGMHRRGYFVRMRGGPHESAFFSLVDAAAYAKDMKHNRCPILFVPGCEAWLAFVVIGDGFARYDSADLPFERALAKAAGAR